MSLAELIRKRDLGEPANAKAAKVANDNRGSNEPLARLAALALAKFSNPEPFDTEAFEERAAIMEFEAGVTRPEAESLALVDVLKGLGHAA